MLETNTLEANKLPEFSKVHLLSARILGWTRTLLVATVWVSAGLFGLYILAFYVAALSEGKLTRWNEILPGLYSEGATQATTGIGLHFFMGGIILVLGSIQLIDAVRIKYPAIHRAIGRIYLIASLFAALGGLSFIFIKGTIGGMVMNIGFGLYGLLMILCSVATYKYAVARKTDQHRAWALRLYALAIGSWLYRMDYGFWILLTGGAGHNSNFTGLFDGVMAFFFYLPNLLVAEIVIRSDKNKTPPTAINIVFTVILLGVISFLLLGTYFFTKEYWGPAIIKWLA
ncbi:DUF2306 domain-containing protein [Emticicia sp. 17c]|uniref:DUF2306 domain-containing protein n=1 Tax=Emticicia sp. 17c TaxID=3127704 RepID=UPI00301DC9BA